MLAETEEKVVGSERENRHTAAKTAGPTCSQDINHTLTLESLEDQLRMAGLVQRDFLPKTLPHTDKIRFGTLFQPAEWVSGDIYDVTRLDEQHIGFYIADAVGHSMPAALLTMFLKQAIVMRETTGDDYRIFGPAEVMSRLNRKMARQKLSGCLFATCIYCLLNIRTMQLTFCRAGHTYPILIRSGEKPAMLESRGSLLGVFEDAEFEPTTVQLGCGDKLLFYSDGLEPVLGQTDDNQEFILNPEFSAVTDTPIDTMLDGLTACARNFRPNIDEIDDMTAIGLEILP